MVDNLGDRWNLDEREVAELIWCAAHLHLIIAPLSLVKDEKEERKNVDSFEGNSSSHDSSNHIVNNSPIEVESTDNQVPVATYPKNSGKPSKNLEQKETSSGERASPLVLRILAKFSCL